jgi:hypothetical protein
MHVDNNHRRAHSLIITRQSWSYDWKYRCHSATVSFQSEKPRPKLKTAKQAFLVEHTSLWSEWKNLLVIVKPERVIKWLPKCVDFSGNGNRNPRKESSPEKL